MPKSHTRFPASQVTFISVDDKSKVTLGQCMVKKQKKLLMRMDSPTKFLDHDFPSPDSKLLVSVYAVCRLKEESTHIGDAQRVSYSGPTAVFVRSGACALTCLRGVSCLNLCLVCSVRYCSLVRLLIARTLCDSSFSNL